MIKVEKYTILMVATVMIFTGCGKVKELTDEVARYREMKAQYEQLKTDYNFLKNKYDRTLQEMESYKNKYEKAQSKIEVYEDRTKDYMVNFHKMIRE
jgi:molecular chaperone GrpE (heat shock protein)